MKLPKPKLKATVLIATGVVVLGGAGVLASNHYQNNKKPDEKAQLQKEVETLTEAVDHEEALKAQAQAVAIQGRTECERVSVAYSYLTAYQKRLIGAAPTCPPANSIPQ